MPRHPDLHVKLVGEDGNAFAILGRCRAVMRTADLPQDEVNEFFAEATAGDYDHPAVHRNKMV